MWYNLTQLACNSCRFSTKLFNDWRCGPELVSILSQSVPNLRAQMIPDPLTVALTLERSVRAQSKFHGFTVCAATVGVPKFHGWLWNRGPRSDSTVSRLAVGRGPRSRCQDPGPGSTVFRFPGWLRNSEPWSGFHGFTVFPLTVEPWATRPGSTVSRLTVEPWATRPGCTVSRFHRWPWNRGPGSQSTVSRLTVFNRETLKPWGGVWPWHGLTVSRSGLQVTAILSIFKFPDWTSTVCGICREWYHWAHYDLRRVLFLPGENESIAV